MTDTQPSPSPERRVRTWLAGSAALALAGLALTGTGHRAVGGLVLLSGWGFLISAIHRFGRLGSPSE